MESESPADRYTILTTCMLPSGQVLVVTRYFWLGQESLEERMLEQMRLPGVHSVMLVRSSKEEIEAHLEAEYGIMELLDDKEAVAN